MEEPEDSEGTPAPEKKKKSKFLVVAIVTAALVVSAAVAGVVLGPKIASARGQAPAKKPPPEARIGEVITLEPIVVDTRSEDNAIHHIKVALSVELKEGASKDEFMKFQPRGREAAVAYLRGEPFEVVAAPQRFADVRKELGRRVIEAVGERRVERVLVTDFVAQ